MIIGKLKELVSKLTQKPQIIRETQIGSHEATPYSEMVINDLMDKYDERTFEVPIQLINFDAFLELLVQMEHSAIQDKVTRPYVQDDFEDLGPILGELITDYMNTHLKLLVNAAITSYMDEEKIKISAHNGVVSYYSEEDDKDIDALIELERTFRAA